MEAVAKLRNYPTSPRKMRLMADMIRGIDVEKALSLLKYSKKHASRPMERLLISAISNWESKTGFSVDGSDPLYVKVVTVDSGRMLKRFRPAPFGRAHRIRKRSNHITLVIDTQGNGVEDNNSES
jgi:large subunit ribosomal protein L22